MSRMNHLARIMALPLLGAVLLAANGCGNGSVKLEPDGGEKLKQARLNAYGASGTTPGTASAAAASGSGAGLSPQAAARQRAQSGH